MGPHAFFVCLFVASSQLVEALDEELLAVFILNSYVIPNRLYVCGRHYGKDLSLCGGQKLVSFSHTCAMSH